MIDSAASSRICRWLEAPVVSVLIKYALQTRTDACHHAGDNTTDQLIEAMRENEPAPLIVYSFSAANSDPPHIVSLQSYVNASFCAHYMRIQ